MQKVILYPRSQPNIWLKIQPYSVSGKPKTTSTTSFSTNRANLPFSSSRSSLLEAIRNAGGASNAGLKSVQQSSVVNDANSKSGGGDYMSDLASQLAMRRKSISGMLNAPSTSTMDKISNLIPTEAVDVNNVSDDDDDEWK